MAVNAIIPGAFSFLAEVDAIGQHGPVKRAAIRRRPTGAAQRRKRSDNTKGRRAAVPAPIILQLVPELVHQAQGIVDVYDRCDWEEVRVAGCDTVHISFQSEETLKLASQILLQMAAGNPGWKNKIVGNIKKNLEMFCVPAATATKSEKALVRRIEDLLKVLRHPTSSRQFAASCRDAWLLCCKKQKAVARRSQLQVKGALQAKAPPPRPPVPFSHPPDWAKRHSGLARFCR